VLPFIQPNREHAQLQQQRKGMRPGDHQGKQHAAALVGINKHIADQDQPENVAQQRQRRHPQGGTAPPEHVDVEAERYEHHQQIRQQQHAAQHPIQVVPARNRSEGNGRESHRQA